MKKLLALVSLFAALNIAADNITLTWDPPADSTIIGYRLYESIGTQPFTMSATVTGNTVNKSSVNSETKYYVVSFNSAGVESTPSNTVIYTPAPITFGLAFEAEQGTIASPFVNNGTNISQPTTTFAIADSGRATYRFTVPETGDYTISVMLNAPAEDSNSIFINVDAEPTDPYMIWDIMPVTAGTFQSRTVSWRGNGASDANEFVPKKFSLPAGVHTLIVRGREGGVVLDSFQFIKSQPPAPPAAPTNLRATPISTSRIDLQWFDDSSNVVLVERSQNGSTFSQIGSSTSDTFLSTGLSRDRIYYYRVRGRNSDGTFTAYSNTANARTFKR